MPARRLIVFLLVVAAVALTLWLWLRPDSRRPGEVAAPAPSPAAPITTPPAPVPAPPALASRETAALPEEEPGRLAADLNAAGGSIQRDLTLLDGVLQAWRSNFPQEGNPVGDNIEITAALAGRNDLGVAFIPRDHPAINDRGQLCDRWGTPFFFHQIAGDRMELRSAGPDRKLYTEDDAVLDPAGADEESTSK